MTRTAEKLKTLEQTPPWEWPENAGAVLLGVLRDRGAAEDERVLAASPSGFRAAAPSSPLTATPRRRPAHSSS